MDISALRILVVYPMYGGSLPVSQYCALALEDLGCSVRRFEAEKLYCAYTGLKELNLAPSRINSLSNSFLRLLSQAVVMMAEEQQPDLVLALAQAPLDRTSLLKLRKMGIPTVMWFVEDYQVFNYWTLVAPLYNAFAVIQKEPFLSELRKIGQEHAFYLPLAALPQFHKKVELSEEDKKTYGSDISFMGAGYPNRRLAFRPLAGRDFKIWGSDWEGEKLLENNIQLGGRRINADESVKIYNASRVNLNLHSSINTESLISHGDFVNPRVFELAAMGAFQLVDKRKLMEGLFGPDELATFEDLEDLYQKIDYFLDNPEKRAEYAQRSQERVLREHSYQQRMRTLLEYMEHHFGPLARNTANRVQEGMELPEKARKKAEEIARKLHMPVNASFTDIIERLRSESGILDDNEIALLFLDEWQKQYR